MLGLYYATRERRSREGCYREGTLRSTKNGKSKGYLRGVYASPDEVRMAYDNGEVDLHAGIKVRVIDSTRGQRASRVDTTVGRVLIGEVLPRRAAVRATSTRCSTRRRSAT